MSKNSILKRIEQMKKKHLKWNTENYEVRIGEDINKVLIERLRLVLSQQQIIRNTRILARYILGKTNKLKFDLLPIEVDRSEPIDTKSMILTKTARELGMNKSTLWYQRKRLQENDIVRLYDKTKRFLN